MQWWAWIAVGAILLGSELAFVDAQFYLVFIGASALVVGFLDLAGLLHSRLAAVAAVRAARRSVDARLQAAHLRSHAPAIADDEHRARSARW